MNKVLLFLYIVSVIAVMLAFYAMNFLTEPINTESNLGGGGGNGNPALFILAISMPFIFIFLYGTTELFMRVTQRKKNRKAVLIGLISSLVAIVIIGFYTINKALAFRHTIVEQVENFENVNQLSLWNSFSNPIFFNPLTFFMLVLICFLIGSIWALNRMEKH